LGNEGNNDVKSVIKKDVASEKLLLPIPIPGKMIWSRPGANEEISLIPVSEEAKGIRF